MDERSEGRTARPLAPPPRAAPARRRLTPAERLPQLLDAALEEFVERGYAGASMAGAAGRAGVAKALLYHYVPGKPELFQAVIRSCVQPVFAEAERLVAAQAGPRLEILLRLIEMGYQRIAAQDREGRLFRLLLAEAERFPELAAFYHQEVLSRGLALASEVVRSGVAAGEFRADAAEQPGLAAVLMAPVAMAGVWRTMLGEAQAPPAAAMLQAHLALVRHGLARR